MPILLEMDDALAHLTSSSVGVVEMKLALSELDARDLVLAAGCSLDRSPGKNWVEESGGLPEYICRVARSIHKKRGMPVSRAIAIAVGTVKRWARGGGDVDADTRAKAAAAVAQWEAKRAKARAT